MNAVILAILAVLVGLFLCVRGQWALRLLLSVWGAFAGFNIGAGLMSSWRDVPYLDSLLDWVVALVLAFLFAGLAYLYYAIAVMIGLASMGFVVGSSIASALGANQTWILVSIGLVAGILVAVVALAVDMPQIILIVLSAAAGASVAVSGVMVLFGAADLDDVLYGRITASDHPWWYLGITVLTVVGIVVQTSRSAALRSGMRESWNAPARNAPQ